ncbi:MAG: hypothetical protein DDT21_00948 [Syntrophomonadaceae bacterium]|nr:hypothetical protein [Bacillota bacterium]
METSMVTTQSATTCLPAFLPAGKLCPVSLPAKQAAVALGPPADSGPADKEPVSEGEFAVLLAALQGQAVKARGVSGPVTPEPPAPAGLPMAEQPACLQVPGAGVLLTQMQEKPPAGTEAVWLSCLNLPGSAETQASPMLKGAWQEYVSRKTVVAGLKPGEQALQAVPLNGQQLETEPAKTVPLPESAAAGLKPGELPLPAAPLNGQTAAEKALATALPEVAGAEAAEPQGLKTSFEQQPPPQGEENAPGPAKAAFAGTELPSAVRAERSLTGGPDREQGEGKPAESSSQAVFKATGSVPEPVQAEIVQRLQSVKSAVVEQVLEKMVFSRTESGEVKVFIRLKPPALGEVEISLQMEEGRLTGRIVAESLLVREVLEASLGQLRQRLEAQQIQVAELTVGSGQEKGFHHGRDRTEALTPFPWGREQQGEEASPLPAAAPGLLNALA